MAPSPESPSSTAHYTIPVRNSDLLLAILFGVLIYYAHDLPQKALLLGLAVLQLVEGRVSLLTTSWGRMASVFVQLALGIELMHLDGDIARPYYPVLLLPVVSTATYLGVVATVVAS